MRKYNTHTFYRNGLVGVGGNLSEKDEGNL